MKAVVYHEYGLPDVLRLEEVEKPSPREGEILVQVYAASVNYADWATLTGKPFLVRLMVGGILKPKHTILGFDIAGRVEAVGKSVKEFKVGDEVFGDVSAHGGGGFAEYISVPENALALKPVNMSFNQAAAVPLAGVTALQGVRKGGKIKPGQKVLINGASGGVGTYAVQIAKSFGTEVTAVCSTSKMDMLRSIGADHVIDYTKENFTRNGQQYDLIIGANGHHSLLDYKRALSPDGTYVCTGGTMAQIFGSMLLGPLASIGGSKKMGNLAAKPNQKDLVVMKELLEAGKVVPVIDRCYPLNEVPEALRYLGEGHARGKVVITMKESK